MLAPDRYLFATLLALAVLVAVLPVSAANLLANGDFEAGFAPTGIADGWGDNSSWANLDVAYSRETVNPHSGKACQRITCKRLSYGAVQMVPVKGLALRKGAIYRVRCWGRGDAGTLAVQPRQAGAPYRVYIEQGLRTGPGWTLCEYLWTSDVDDPRACFMLRFTQTGTLYVDDISVEELSPEEALRGAPEPRRGNLLPNGDFAFGLANWLVGHGCDDWQEAKLAVEGEVGPRRLRVEVPAGVSATVSSDVVPVVPGRPVALSCKLRADRATNVIIASQHLWKQVAVTTEPQAFAAEGKVGFGPRPYDFVRVQITGPATVWLEDVQLRQDGQTAPVPRVRAAIISDGHPMSLYHDGETPKLRLMSDVPPGSQATQVTWRVEDFWGRTRGQGTRNPGPGYRETAVPTKALGRGWYRAVVEWTVDGHRERNESALCILPPAGRTGRVEDSPFGSHFSLDPTGIRLARAVGVRWLRLHPPNHTKWRVVEPKQGQWDWHDEAIRIAREAGFAIIGSLDRCPTWASTAPPGVPEWDFYTGSGAWLPRDWAQWEEYVALTVRRYKQDIHVWEVWNEPNLDDWLRPREGQTRPQAYVEILQHTYPIVKREDPTAQVIGGVIAGTPSDASPAGKFAQDLIGLGVLKLLDTLSFHDYIAQPVDEATPPIAEWLPKLRERMRAAGKEVPIINSEGGFANPGTCFTYRPADASTTPPDAMAKWLVRQYVAQIALGIKQFDYYNMFVNGSPVTQMWDGFVEGDGQPRPSVAAYATMTWLLDGAKFVRSEHPTANLWLHRFSTSRGTVIVAWARTGQTVAQRFPGATQAWDVMGATVKLKGEMLAVTDAPMYVLVKGR